MGWLALPAGLAYGLAVAASAVIARQRRGGSIEAWQTVAAGASLAFSVAAVPVILATGDRIGGDGLGRVATIGCAIAVAGLGVDAAARLAEARLSIGLTWATRPLYFVGFVGFHLWIAIASAIALAGGSLPPGLAWLGLGAVLAAVSGTLIAVSRSESDAGVEAWWFAAAYLPQAAIVAWMICLAFIL